MRRQGGLRGFCARERGEFLPRIERGGKNKRPSQDNRGINGILIQWIGQMARDEWS